MATKNKMLQKVYGAKNHQEVMDVYKEWAADYDADTVTDLGYVAHIASTDALIRVLDSRDAYILDAGCGTGLVGEELARKGYRKLDALDYSSEMLDVSKHKKIYRQLFQADMNLPLDIETDCYDAVVCAGSFSYSHINATAFDELVRITKPGGFICFTIREGAYEDCGYRDRMMALEKEGAWKLIHMRDADYLKNVGVTCKLCTYKVMR